MTPPVVLRASDCTLLLDVRLAGNASPVHRDAVLRKVGQGDVGTVRADPTVCTCPSSTCPSRTRSRLFLFGRVSPSQIKHINRIETRGSG